MTSKPLEMAQDKQWQSKKMKVFHNNNNTTTTNNNSNNAYMLKHSAGHNHRLNINGFIFPLLHFFLSCSLKC